ncbi:MAG: hypothetical protein NTY36_08385 [Deltaproteobacteria bacterium]|nr:hypothetical protein [Deltaproteobacteria bacterium]
MFEGEPEYPWFTLVPPDTPLRQGDLIENCPIIIPISSDIKPGGSPTIADIISFDVIVMTQSCDLQQFKVGWVVVCAVWPLQEIGRKNDIFRSNRGKEALRQGNMVGFHLLNKIERPGFERDYQIVDFRELHTVPFSFLTEFVKGKKQRIRLLPPYREHLSQAFARFFMRVGLPIDIPPFKGK